jgi:hypothetical protein
MALPPLSSHFHIPFIPFIDLEMAERAPRVFTDPAIEHAKRWLNDNRDRLHDYKGLCDSVNAAGYRTLQGTQYDHQQWQNKLNKASGQLKTFLDNIGFFKEDGALFTFLSIFNSSLIGIPSGPPKKKPRVDAGPVGINQQEQNDDDDDDGDYMDDDNDEKGQQVQQIIPPARLGSAPEREKELTRDPFEFSDTSRIQDILKTKSKITLLLGKTVSEKLGVVVRSYR